MPPATAGEDDEEDRDPPRAACPGTAGYGDRRALRRSGRPGLWPLGTVLGNAWTPTSF